MITAGIDCGAKTTKTVILKDGTIIGKGMVLTGFDPVKAVEDSLDKAVKQAGIARKDIQRIGGTGSGKAAVRIANDSVNDIKAMARGAFYFFPKARTVADVGAEEGRAARLDDKGQPGGLRHQRKVRGRRRRLHRGHGAGARGQHRGDGAALPAVRQGDSPSNAQCAIFAESEVVGLIHSKTAKPDISRAIHDSIASRIVSMIRRIGVNEDVALIGGLALNPGFMASITRQLKVDQALHASGSRVRGRRGCGGFRGRSFQVKPPTPPRQVGRGERPSSDVIVE